MEVVDVLDAAMYDRRALKMETMARGTIIGTPHFLDEFESDPDRLGYAVLLSRTTETTVFLDEVTRITDAKTGEVLIDVMTAADAPHAVAV
ncbi:hypothetical protein R80B4_02624 [Fibrobacteres bacterium R8-0-B4]